MKANKSYEQVINDYLAEVKTASALKQVANDISHALCVAYKQRLEELQTAKDSHKKAEKAVKKTASKAVKQIKATSLTAEDVEGMGIEFKTYSEKCRLLIGDTKPIKEEIKKVGGHWNTDRKGWFLTNKAAEKLAAKLGVEIA